MDINYSFQRLMVQQGKLGNLFLPGLLVKPILEDLMKHIPILLLVLVIFLH